jgi:hypothetical protein
MYWLIYDAESSNLGTPEAHVVLRLVQKKPEAHVLVGPCPTIEEVRAVLGHDRFQFDEQGRVVFSMTPRLNETS